MVNIGIIGTGFGAKIHVPGFRAVGGVRVLGVAGSSLSKTFTIARELGVPIVFSSWTELVDHPQIDAVSIVSPPALHKSMALYAARREKHIFCEKPLAMSAVEGSAMLSAARRARIVHAVDFEFRNIPGLKALAKLLRKKIVGEIRRVNVSWLTGGRTLAAAPSGWQSSAKSGGGILFSHIPHAVDYIELLFGKIESVSALLDKAKKGRGTAQDSCDMLLSLANGIKANVSVSNVLPNGRGHAIEVYGDKGSLLLENSNLADFTYGFRLYHQLGAEKRKEIGLAVPKNAKKYADARLPLFIETAENFVMAIKNGRGATPSFADGLRVQRVLDAARRSDALKKEVFV